MTQYTIEDMVRYSIQEYVPFNKFLGLRLDTLDPFQLTFEMREEMVGNSSRGILHGGVTAAVLDATGGACIIHNLLMKLANAPHEEILKQIQKVGTIDMRIDFLRQGRGTQFFATSALLRAGNKIGVTRMELHNENNEHIASATGSYIIG